MRNLRACVLAVSIIGAPTLPAPSVAATTQLLAGAQPACINDPRGLASLQGEFQQKQQPAPRLTIVRVFPESDVTEFYMQGIEQQLSGHPGSSATAQTNSSNDIAKIVQQMQSIATLLSSAKSAVVDTDGRFSCSGFLPGHYVFLATPMTGQHSYWRSDAEIPGPNRRRAYVLPSFRYLGQAPGP
jgi:hypothetical protein